MAGHSQFANIMHRKGAQDKKRSKIFQKMTREIHVAVKLAGVNPESNAKLRSILEKAKAVNMPKDIIKRAIDRAASLNNTTNYEALIYEGYGPASVAFIIHCLTDNKNRTASNIRSYFTKCHGKLGTTNSVQYLFKKVGVISFVTEKSLDEIIEIVLDYDIINWEMIDKTAILTINPEHLSVVVKVLADAGIENLINNQIQNIAIDNINITDEVDLSLNYKLINFLEDDDDVQFVEHNLKLPEGKNSSLC